MSIKKFSLDRFMQDTRGETGFVEWLVLCSVIALAGLAIFKQVHDGINESAKNVSEQIKKIK